MFIFKRLVSRFQLKFFCTIATSLYSIFLFSRKKRGITNHHGHPRNHLFHPLPTKKFKTNVFLFARLDFIREYSIGTEWWGFFVGGRGVYVVK